MPHDKRDRAPEPQAKHEITDLPSRQPDHQIPRDLPSPRHRPGEPILYDPPASEIAPLPTSFPEWNREQHLP